MKNKRNQILGILLGLAAMAGILVYGIFMVNERNGEKTYLQQIEKAEKYLNERNYSRAAVEYQGALEKNPKREEAYIGLSRVYEQQENYTEMARILQQGYEATGSNRLHALLNIAEKENADRQAEAEPEEEDDENNQLMIGAEDGTEKNLEESEDIAWNRGMLDKISDYNYGDFKREYGEGEVSFEEDFLVVYHKSAGLFCYYRNTEENPSAVDMISYIPYASGKPEKIRADSLGQVFDNFSGRLSGSGLKRLSGQEPDYSELEGRRVVSLSYGSCRIYIEVHEDGDISGYESWNEIWLSGTEGGQDTDSGEISGYVVSALNDPIPNAVLSFTNRTDPSVKAEDVTAGSGGTFHAVLSPGTYEIRIKASHLDEKYIDDTYEVTVTRNSHITGISIVLGIKSEGLMRIVLDWGSLPSDLDSYLIGSCNGQNVFVGFTNRLSKGNNFEARLDADVTRGYGPETITFEGDLENADITYSIVDFNMTGTLGKSNAKVRVYWTDGTVQEIPVPAEAVNYWGVFQVKQGELFIINDLVEPPMRQGYKNQ